MNDYRLPPAHRRKILRMRAVLDDPSRSREVHTDARAYLSLHVSCEAFLAAQAAGEIPSERPRCAQGNGKNAKITSPVLTSVCPVCKKQKSVLSFDDELRMCIKCRYKKVSGGTGRAKSGSKEKKPAPTRNRKCPVCLHSVTVTLKAGDWTVEPHTKHTRDGFAECRAGGQVLYRELSDAMDLRAPGSFEGGKRR